MTLSEALEKLQSKGVLKPVICLHQPIILTLFEFYFTIFFRITLWLYYLFRICLLVGYLLNKVHVVFDAFDSSCCSYVHKKILKKFKKKKEKKKRPFGLGPLVP